MSKSKKILGIDLGSYNVAISVYEGSEIKVIPNAEGSLTTPSYVAFTKDGSIKVGESAKRQAVINPENTIFNIKRLMGKTYEQVKHLKRPYKIVNSNGKAAIEVNGRIYTPEEISAMILQKAKKTAEDFLGEEIEKCIITVPAYFNSDERRSTEVSGEIAGLKVERIINEPTAAVLNVDANSCKKFCVYDFGGQTFDLSVVDVADGVFEVLASDGDLDLGGSLIDEAIVNWLADEFKKSNGVDLRKDPMAFQRLYESAEKAKIELSGCASSEINLPYITSVDGMPKHLVINLSRAKFDQLAEPIIDRTISKSKDALAKSGLKAADIDTILLVGGSSRIPLAQDKLAKMFGKTPSKELNPDLCVSTGATKQGGVLSGDVKDILLLDVMAISLGLETSGGIFTKMIESNTTIPCKKENIFSTAQDQQSSVEINVLQGERPMAMDNKSLGRFMLDGIPPSPKGVPQIEVSFEINSNGILSVSAKDKATGKQNNIRIEGGTSLSKDEIQRMKDDAEKNADNDKKELEKIEKHNQADALIYQTDKQIKEFGDKLSDVNKTNLTDALEELKNAQKSGDIAKIDESINKLTDVWNKVSTEMYQSTSDSNKTEEPVTTEYEDVK